MFPSKARVFIGYFQVSRHKTVKLFPLLFLTIYCYWPILANVGRYFDFILDLLYKTVPRYHDPERFRNWHRTGMRGIRSLFEASRPKGPSDDDDDLTSHGRVIKRFPLHRYQPLEFFIYWRSSRFLVFAKISWILWLMVIILSLIPEVLWLCYL